MHSNWLIFRDPKLFLVELIVIILSIALHEFGHAISADRLGDDTPRRQGRVTLWPDKHFDPAGFIMILFTLNMGFGLGWGKPVQVNFGRMRHPRRDMLIVAACGPLMNLVLAILAGLIIRLFNSTGHSALLGFFGESGFEQTLTGQFLDGFLSINLALMFFNLIPIHPLDGSKILSSLLPIDMAIPYDRFMGQWGPLLILAIAWIAPSSLGAIIGPAIASSAHLIIG